MSEEYISRNRILNEIGRIGGNVGSNWTTLGVITLVAGQPKVDVVPTEELVAANREIERLKGELNV